MTGTPTRTAISDPPPRPGDGDAELYARLAADGFTGPVYERVMSDRLCPYACQVIRAWVPSGLIFTRCAEKGVKGVPAGEDWTGWTKEDIEDLVQETVAGAELKFRSDGLRGAGWRPGGASLAAYFITGCLFAFACAYKRRRRDRDRNHAALAAARHAPAPDRGPDVAEAVTNHAEAVERVTGMIPDPRLRLIMHRHADGWSNTEISQALADGTTPRAVEGMIYRCKHASRGESDGHR